MRNCVAGDVLNNEWHATHAEVGEVLGISRQAAAQIEHKALAKLRRGLERHRYPSHDLIEALRELDGNRW
jgi:DNA-directed RNA polymerase sigma subunit (sigma70/sigma32)